MISSGNAKVRERKLQSGEVVYDLSICKNFRIHGRGPTSRLLKGLGSVRKSEIPKVAAYWWKKTDAIINELVASGVLMKNCADKIRKQLEAVIPRVSAPVAKTATAVTVGNSPNKDAIRAALAEIGIHNLI